MEQVEMDVLYTLEQMRDLSQKIVADCASQEDKRKLLHIVETMHDMYELTFAKKQAE